MSGLTESDVMDWSQDDEAFMRQALLVAEKGRGQVRPNPLVGCVLVRDGKVIAEGWHDHLGGLHAEQMAISDAERRGISTNGSTAYVTLEPCNHHGRTPPCTEALLWAGITDVIVAHSDPNPTVRGNGIEYLRGEGFSVKCGLLEDKAAQQMQSFLHWCEQRKPLVTLKIATDANGAVDDRAGKSERFTSEESLDAVHRLRRDCDTVLIGVETAIRDDPQLTIRRIDIGLGRQPLRVVLDPNLRIPAKSKLICDGMPTLILHLNENIGVAKDLGKHENVEVIRVAKNTDDSGIDLDSVMALLGERECQEILLEGGPITAKKFLQQGLIDRAIIITTEADFSQPYHLGISPEDFTTCGLTQIIHTNWGEDSVKMWSRPNLDWPTPNWP